MAVSITYCAHCHRIFLIRYNYKNKKDIIAEDTNEYAINERKECKIDIELNLIKRGQSYFITKEECINKDKTLESLKLKRLFI
jgi:hypothetical protein